MELELIMLMVGGMVGNVVGVNTFLSPDTYHDNIAIRAIGTGLSLAGGALVGLIIARNLTGARNEIIIKTLAVGTFIATAIGVPLYNHFGV